MTKYPREVVFGVEDPDYLQQSGDLRLRIGVPAHDRSAFFMRGLIDLGRFDACAPPGFELASSVLVQKTGIRKLNAYGMIVHALKRTPRTQPGMPRDPVERYDLSYFASSADNKVNRRLHRIDR